MKLTVMKQADVLMPMTADDVDALKALPENSVYVISISQSRNPLYHRRAFKMLRIMYDMIDSELEFEPWRAMLTILAGYCDTVAETTQAGNTRVYVYPKSLQYEKMKEEEFHNWFKAVHAAFVRKFGNKLTLDQLDLWASM